MKKIILSNLLIFFFIFCIIEFGSYLFIKIDTKDYIDNHNKTEKRQLTIKYAPILIAAQEYENHRKIDYGNKNKPSILFFGCSYTYGLFNDQNETLPYYITERTGRTTVNRGVPGGCIYNMFHDLKSEKFYKEIKDIPEPDYIIYIWINDHLNRITNPYMTIITAADYPYYEIKPDWVYKDGKLIDLPVPKWEKPFYALYCTKLWNLIYAQSFVTEKRDEKMLRYFITARNVCKDKFPKAKFIVIEYKDQSFELMKPKLKEGLKKENIPVLDAEELAGHELESDKWRTSDKNHPNGKAFNDVANGLIKKLNL